MGFLVFIFPVRVVHAGRPSSARPEQSLETLAKQWVATGAPSVGFALERLAQDSRDPEAAGLAAFLLGYSAFQKEDFETALKFLANSNLKDLGIADYAVLYRARSEHQLKRYSEALNTLEDFRVRFPDSNLNDEVVREICRVLVEDGDPKRCVNMLQEQPNFDSAPRYLLIAAQAHEAAGSWDDEAKLLQRIAYDFPLSSEVPQANERMEWLRRHHPGSVLQPSPQRVRARGEVFFAQRRYKDALADFQSVARVVATGKERVSPEEGATVSLRVGECLLRLGRLREAATALRRAQPLPGEDEAEKLFALSEVQRKLSGGSPEELEQSLAELETKYPSSPWTEAAFFSLGNYFLVHQDRPRATRQFEKMAQWFPQGKNIAEASFRVAWGAYLRRDYREAQLRLKNFVGRFPESSRAVAAYYWLGRIAEMFSAEEAAAYYRAVVRGFGESRYAQSARERFSKLPVDPALVRDIELGHVGTRISLQDEIPPNPKASAAKKRAERFRRIALTDLEARELRAVLERTRSVSAAAELARIDVSKQNYGGAMGVIRQIFPDYYRAPLEQLPPEFWHDLFPLPYWAVIQREAQRKDVDPYLVAALIRQESAFNPEARSHADALGLMQLLPREARRYARKEKIPRWRTNKIFDPEINIRLGVAYLADAIHRYNGSLELALAAYNAGDERVETWVQEQSMAGAVEDPMEFVESIPFTETREYVQILLRNLSYYKRIYGPAA